MLRLGYNNVTRSLTRQWRPLRSLATFNSSLRLSPIIRTQLFHHTRFLKHNSNDGNSNSSDDPKKHHIGSFKVEKPQYMLAFTCKKCNHRSSHTISKQAYHHGTVMVKCPKCNNRHLIADHLKIFNDKHITIQDIMKAKGETVSQSTDDLVFDDIPESLKGLIGHYAKDAPQDIKDQKKLNNDDVHHLPPPSTDNTK